MSSSPAIESSGRSSVDALVEYWNSTGVLDSQSLDRGRRAATAGNDRLDRVLNKLGLISDDAYALGWSVVTGWPVVTAWPVEPLEVAGLPARFLSRAFLAPMEVNGGTIHLAVGDPLDTFSVAAVRAKTGLEVVPYVAKPTELQAALDLIITTLGDRSEASAAPQTGLLSDIDRLRDLESEAPAVRAVELVIDRAVELGASDIHIHPTINQGRIRVRVDGVLRDLPSWSKELVTAATSRLKVMAGLDIAETRLPQDGRLRIPHRGVELDLRIATIPQVHGEGIVLRVLHRARATPDLAKLGLPLDVLAGLDRIIAAPNGLLLVTGPTGSGKTTTLYATLQKLARPDRNIITVEDPVEHALEGTAQVQVDRRIGFDFSVALRSVLRHDPDVVMIGEIRDSETASIAIRAALTGHLVLATVHTNSAVSAIPRLVDMGIEPWLVASTLRGAMAQRLMRKLCPSCKTKADCNAELTDRLALLFTGRPKCEAVFKPVGCAACAGTGYHGRIAIGEFITVTPGLLSTSAKDLTETHIASLLPAYRTMRDDALERVASGQTSLSEAERVLGGELASGDVR